MEISWCQVPNTGFRKLAAFTSCLLEFSLQREIAKSVIQKSTSNKCWKGCGEKGTLLHCWWECKLVQPLWRTVWRFLKKLEIELPSVQFSWVVQSYPTLYDPMNHNMPGLPVHHQLPEFTETHVHQVSDAIQPSHPLASPSPPAPNPSRLSNESTLRMRWPKYWSFSFSIIPFKEIPGLISFRMNWLDLLGVQGTLKSLLQHHSSKASVLQRSAFFTVQLSHPYMTTGKTIALTRQTFVGKVMSLLFNMLSRLVITFLPRSKRLLISWLQSPSAVILEPQKIRSDTVSTVSPSISHEVMGPDVMISVFWMLSFKPTFSLSSFILIKRLFSSSLLSAVRVVSSAYLKLEVI